MIALAFLRESYFGGLFHVKQDYSSRKVHRSGRAVNSYPLIVALRLLCPSLKTTRSITTRTIQGASASRRRPGAAVGAI